MFTKIKQLFDASYSKKVMDFLWTDDREIPFKDSCLYALFNKYTFSYAAEISLILALIVYWYEFYLVDKVPYISNFYLAPVILVGGLVLAKKDGLKFRKFHLWFIGFLAVMLISAIISQLTFQNGWYLFTGWYLFAQILLVIVLSQVVAKKDLVIKSLLGLSIPFSLYAIYQYFNREAGIFDFSYLESAGVRASGFFTSPNVLGMVGAVVFLLSLGLYFQNRRKIHLLFSFLPLLATIFSFSRTGWLALGFGLVALVLLYGKKYLYLTPLVLVALAFERIRERILLVFDEKYLLDALLDGRIWSFSNGLYIFRNRPFLGSGPGTYGGLTALQNASPIYLESMQNGYTALYLTDNQYLQILVQSGIIGALFFISMIMSYAHYLFRNRTGIYTRLAIPVFIAFLVMGFFANTWEFNALTLPVGILIGFSLSEGKK